MLSALAGGDFRLPAGASEGVGNDAPEWDFEGAAGAAAPGHSSRIVVEELRVPDATTLPRIEMA